MMLAMWSRLIFLGCSVLIAVSSSPVLAQAAKVQPADPNEGLSVRRWALAIAIVLLIGAAVVSLMSSKRGHKD